MADRLDFERLRGFDFRLTDRQTDGQTDICDSRVAFATEKCIYYNADKEENREKKDVKVSESEESGFEGCSSGIDIRKTAIRIALQRMGASSSNNPDRMGHIVSGVTKMTNIFPFNSICGDNDSDSLEKEDANAAEHVLRCLQMVEKGLDHIIEMSAKSKQDEQEDPSFSDSDSSKVSKK